MEFSQNKGAFVAADLGAQSCRVSLLRWKQGNPQLEVIHRFPNTPIATQDGLRWDLKRILEGIKTGLRRCAEAATEGIAAVGVDGWAVDYVRLTGDGSPLANPFCYRDQRTRKAQQEVHQMISPERLYALTGIQLLGLNTLYQLYADKLIGIDSPLPWINLPEYITYRLGGKPVAEYTNATHTQLVRLGTHQWCDEIFQTVGLNVTAAPEIVPTGSIVGTMGGELADLPAFRKTQLIVPACHDTASAIAAIPADGDDWAFISSGTWSLVGRVMDSPCVTEGAQRANFTNLGGVGGTICFLKNVNGMWLLRQCMDEWEARGHPHAMEDLVQECACLPPLNYVIDVDEPELLLPGNTVCKINAQLKRAGRPEFSPDADEIPLIANLIFHSLAARYAEVLSSIAGITGKRHRRLFIVGGGSRNTLLNRLAAERTGLEVIPGAIESTTVGNLAIQIAALRGDWSDSTGVTAFSVRKWARDISSQPLVPSLDPERN